MAENTTSATHHRRVGTAAISGQLYETKTTTLALLNALLAVRRGKVKGFHLGTNVDGIGAADDVVLKYIRSGQEKSKMLFVQCKHRDNTETQRVTLTDMLREDGDFSLIKILNSYVYIMQKSDKKDDVIFGDAHKDMDIIIYTPAEADLENTVEEVQLEKDDFIRTNEKGKVFRFKEKGRHIDSLLDTLSKCRSKLLAKLLVQFILSGNRESFMLDYLVQTYQVWLTKEVLHVSDFEKNGLREVRFRNEFFESKDIFVSRLRELMYREIMTYRKENNITKLKSEEIDQILKEIPTEFLSEKEIEMVSKPNGNKSGLIISKVKSRLDKLQVPQLTVNRVLTNVIVKKLSNMESLKVSVTFGNLDLKIKERRLDALNRRMIEILQNPEITKNNKVTIEHQHVGHNRILTKGDVQVNGGLAGLVGNILVLDEKTKMLKINDDENSLPDNARTFLKKLKQMISDKKLNIDLRIYRFQFNILGLPRLSWIDLEVDKNLLVDFLNKFKFYTGQAKQDKVENIIKEKMSEYYNTDININATFLNVHDKIQKWWQQVGEVEYITETCDYFDQANKPDLLNTLKFIHTNGINNGIEFSSDTIYSLNIESFITQSEQQILNIITSNLILSSTKVLQYFKNNDKEQNNYTIIDLEYVLQNDFYDDMLQELQETQIKYFIVMSTLSDVQRFSLRNILKSVITKDNKKKFIIITNSKLPAYSFAVFKRTEIKDKINGLTDLTSKLQNKLLEETKVVFQGEDMTLGRVLGNEKCIHLIDASVLNKMVTKEKIEIGRILTDKNYENIKDFYIDRKLYRRITINHDLIVDQEDLDADKFKDITIIYNNEINDTRVEKYDDILLISDNVEDFDKLCKNYKNRIHWFINEYNVFSWQKSRGSLDKIRKYVDCDEKRRYGRPLDIDTLTDVEEKIVIVAAGPGMGKSSLLTHLAIATKKAGPLLWIVRINLLDHTSEFNVWKKNNVNINETEIFKFIYKAVNFKAIEEYGIDVLKLIIIDKDGKINLNTDAERNILSPIALLEMQLFNHYYNSGKVAILFDGYDEINPDYKEQTTKLLVLLKNTRIEKLWVTTRPYDIQDELENTLSLFSHTLEPFSDTDQKIFLEENIKAQPQLIESIKGFYRSMNRSEKTFFTAPIHMFMIIKVFQELLRKNSQSNENEQFNIESNLFNFYKRFIDIKINEISFPEKLRITNEDNPGMKKTIEYLRYKTMYYHRILAVVTILDGDMLSNVLTSQELEDLPQVLESIRTGEEKTGVVDRVIAGVPRFVHKTFAEYFIVEYFWEKLKSDVVSNAALKLFFTKLLVHNQNIRKFLDSKLASDYLTFDAKCTNEISYKLFLLIFIINNGALMIAVLEEKLEYMINLGAKIIIDSLNKDTYLSFIRFTYTRPFVKLLLEQDRLDLISHILQRLKAMNVYEIPDTLECFNEMNIYENLHKLEIYDYANMFKVSEFREEYIVMRSSIFACIVYYAIYYDTNRELVTTILRDIVRNSDHIEEILVSHARNFDGSTVLHAVVRRSNLETISPYLDQLNSKQLLNVATAINNNGRTPAHAAAVYAYFDFFDYFRNRLSATDFRRICLAKDEHDRTPISMLVNVIVNNDEAFLMCSSLYNYICPSDNEDDIGLNETQLQDLCMLAAGNEKLFNELHLDDKKKSMKIISEHILNACLNTETDQYSPYIKILHHAIRSNNHNFIRAVLQDVEDPDQIVGVLTAKHGSTNSTLLHLAAKRCSDILTPYCEKLDAEHLIQAATVADDYGWTPAHDAARKNYFSFFEFFACCLHKNQFREICLIQDTGNNTPMDEWSVYDNDEVLLGYLSMCDYICPSEDEDDTEFSENQIWDMYLNAACCKTKFDNSKNGSENKFLTQMLNTVKDFCTSRNSNEIHYAIKLLHRAVVGANDFVIEALLQNVENTDRIKHILNEKPYSSTTLIHLATRYTINPFLPCLDKLNDEDLMLVVSATDSKGRLAIHTAAYFGNIDFVNYLKRRFQEDDFKKLCLAKCGEGKLPIDYVNQASEEMRDTISPEQLADIKDIFTAKL